MKYTNKTMYIATRINRLLCVHPKFFYSDGYWEPVLIRPNGAFTFHDDLEGVGFVSTVLMTIS